MKFLDVYIQNFLIIGEVKLDLADQGLVRIHGLNGDDSTASSNGAGKSSIFEAIYWCLFGDTLRSLKKADSVVNRNVGSNCCVKVRFSQRGKIYRIERYRKDVRKSNGLFLYIDDVDSRGSDNKDTQAIIESIVGFDKTTFANSVAFGQGYSKNLRRFSELTDKEQKECLESVLGTEVYAKAHEKTKERIDAILKEKLKLARSVETINSKIQDLKANIATYTTNLEKFETERAAKICALESAKSAKISELDKIVSDLEGLNYDSDKVTAQEEVIDLVDQLIAVISEKKIILAAKFNEKMNKLKITRGTIEANLYELNAHLSKLSSGEDEGEECHYCGAEIRLDAIEFRRDGLNFEIKDRKSTLYKITKSMESLDSKYKEKAQALAEEEKALLSQKVTAKAEITELKKSQAQAVSLKSKIKVLNSEIASLDTRIAEVVSTSHSWDELIASAKSKVKEYLKSAKETVVINDQLEEQLTYLRFWDSGFSRSGIRSYLLDRYVPYLNERANRYLSLLTDGKLTVQFSTQKQLASGEWRESFNIEVDNQQSADSYEGNSGGEKRKADLGIALAINDLAASRTGSNINMVMLDEVFESVDATGSYYVIRALEEVAKLRESVFVITHQDSLAEAFPKSIELGRRNGRTYVVNC